MPAPLPTRTYPAKVILFGEYTVLLGGSILAVPYPSFAAKWEAGNQNDQRLIDYLNHLITTQLDTLKSDQLLSLKQQAEAGLILQSNLKSGTGLGSSGTLVAAIYDYCKVSDDLKLDSLLKTFVKMESYFHGQSSGIDPLVSYTQSAVLRADDQINLHTDLILPDYTLHDSEIERDTKILVTQFRERLASDPNFASEVAGLRLLNDQIIKGIINQSYDKSLAQNLSNLQFTTLGDFIPESIKALWQEDKASTWKICGAGGGGYFLRLG